MSIPCNLSTPTVFEQDECMGERKSAACVNDTTAYVELSLPPNSTQQQINQALYTAFLNLKATVENLQQQIYNLP